MTHSAARHFHPSNLLTYLSLLAGLVAIVSAKRLETLSVAGGLIALCALVDTLDGRFAHLFERTEKQRQFGIELDSLTDAFTFGLAPVACFYPAVSSASMTLQLLWFAVCFFYVLCAITRLGAYNIQEDNVSGFIGLPTTVSGLIWSSFFLMNPSIVTSIFLLLGCGIAMVSPIRIVRPRKIGMTVFTTWAVVLIILHGVSVTFRL